MSDPADFSNRSLKWLDRSLTIAARYDGTSRSRDRKGAVKRFRIRQTGRLPQRLNPGLALNAAVEAARPESPEWASP